MFLLIYITSEYFFKKLKDKFSVLNLLKFIVVDEVYKVFDRNSEFRFSYDIFKYFYRDFFGVLVMVLIVIFNEEYLKVFCENYFRRFVLIKSTVDRLNIKLNVGKY